MYANESKYSPETESPDRAPSRHENATPVQSTHKAVVCVYVCGGARGRRHASERPLRHRKTVTPRRARTTRSSGFAAATAAAAGIRARVPPDILRVDRLLYSAAWWQRRSGVPPLLLPELLPLTLILSHPGGGRRGAR